MFFCLFCGGRDFTPLGKLGYMNWFRCTGCGSNTGVKDDADDETPEELLDDALSSPSYD